MCFPDEQILASPNYPRPYPGGLECLHVIRAASASPGAVVTLEVTDLDLEPVRDLVLVRDGDRADSRTLAVLSGAAASNPRAVVSTGPALYVYTQTDQSDSRKGYRFRWESEKMCRFLLRFFHYYKDHFYLTAIRNFHSTGTTRAATCP